MKLRNWLEIAASGFLLGLAFLFMILHSNALDRVSVLESDLRTDQKTSEMYEGLYKRESARMEPLKNELDAANRDIQDLSERLEKAENMVALLEASVDETLRPSDDAIEETQADRPNSRMQDILKSMDPDAMAKMQATNVVSLGYRRLFRELGLDAQTEASVRAIILEETAGQMRAMYVRMKDEDAPASLDTEMSPEELRETIRERLGTLLAEDQLQILDVYDLTHETVAGGIETQLMMYAPELSDESAALARDIVMEEILATTEDPVETIRDETSEPWDLQIEAIRNAEARLAEMLSEDEMIRFHRYVEQHMAMAESMRAMMEDPAEPAE